MEEQMVPPSSGVSIPTPPLQVFDNGYKKLCRVETCPRPLVDHMITTKHYLKSWPGVVMKVFVLFVPKITSWMLRVFSSSKRNQ